MEIFAQYSAHLITVYQAYSPCIAAALLQAQRLVPPFRFTRMTWIKPSFYWMAYRSGWGRKEGQEVILEIILERAIFDQLLAQASLTRYAQHVHGSVEDWRQEAKRFPNRVQWDPERDYCLERLDFESLQLGVSAECLGLYDSGIKAITDITSVVRSAENDREYYEQVLTGYKQYPVFDPITAKRLGISSFSAQQEE